MKLRGVDFGNVFLASGALNFFGEGWRQDKVLRLLPGFNFEGATFIAKTTTIDYRKGNMELDKRLQPLSLFPDCVRVYPLKGVVLNSVGLSGPGAESLFREEKWQKRTEPFLISFMAVEAEKDRRLEEVKRFVEIFKKELPNFSTKVGLELNVFCPNTANCTLSLLDDIIDQLTIVYENLNIPIVLKINAMIPNEIIAQVAELNLCDAISVSNTIPWGRLPEKISWRKIFRSNESPLGHLGGGGLSGKPLRLIVANYILEARKVGIEIPFIGGGGILTTKDVDLFKKSGADAISIGCAKLLRPWRVKSIIKHTNKVYGGSK